MPVLRYFFYVGGVLLALLFVANAYGPEPQIVSSTASASAVDSSAIPMIRIRSDRKWPERVVFDTSAPVIAAAPVKTAEAGTPVPAPVAARSAPARVRETFAQFVPVEPKKPAAKSRVAKNRPAPSPMLVAQHQRFGFAANTVW
jgi:hypothetical protein